MLRVYQRGREKQETANSAGRPLREGSPGWILGYFHSQREARAMRAWLRKYCTGLLTLALVVTATWGLWCWLGPPTPASTWQVMDTGGGVLSPDGRWMAAP